MIGKSINEGARLILSRFRLVVLIYALNLVFAFIFVFPVYQAILDTVGGTGFGEELIQRFDLILWSEIISAHSDGLMASLQKIFWVLPLFWVWKTATQMGLIYALHLGAIWPFWSGVYLHTFRGMLLGFFFLPVKLGWIILVYLGLSIAQPYFSSEVEMFWLVGVVFPFVILTGLAIIELFQRYGRLALVISNKKVLQAIRDGFRWPGKSSAISLVYLNWYSFALIVFLLGAFMNAKLHVGFELLLIAFVLQQVILLARTAVSVGWVGSEVVLFEALGAKK